MLLWRRFIISVICLMLSACTSTIMMERMQAGKLCFSAGNFRPAFCRLLPVAVYGYPQAQYAVGYMYYYGYGVCRDTEAGLFWIQQSADQGYRPAICALAIIRRGAPLCETDYDRYYSGDEAAPPLGARTCLPRTRPLPPCPPRRDQLLRSLPPRPYPGNVPRRLMEPVRTETWHSSGSPQPQVSKVILPRISQNNKDAYGLQVYGAFQLNHVKNLQNEMQLSQETRIWHTKHQNKDWYVLTYGSYPSIADAKLAREALPSQVKDLEPWVRNLSGLVRV